MATRNSILDELKHNLSVAQGQMKETVDLRRQDINFQPGDHVYLKLQPYRFKSLAKKLNEKLSPWFYGPFPILEKIRQVAYRLELPSTAKIHPIFHISQLKRSLHTFVPIQPLPTFLTEDMELLVQPESVLAVHTLLDGSREGVPSNRNFGVSFLDVRRNLLQGNIPPLFGFWSDLTMLDFSENRLSGSIPYELGKLENLQILRLSSNRLTGNISA
ncbi:leucine-rich repeat receptor-like serine/threonine-protein kinase At1g17230 [Pistacia vera]|uniref:leucine-rich repeat receptor-like serine/threonine-protein kinase At1g17230 n=1 Tax=Pistacia vera TaxID=55513 RepID=UPI001263B7FB|nr:leucine-rich repeat receptor-like serine/threonine-protein kinase At1g17230 [Pistacia vera]